MVEVVAETVTSGLVTTQTLPASIALTTQYANGTGAGQIDLGAGALIDTRGRSAAGLNRRTHREPHGAGHGHLPACEQKQTSPRPADTKPTRLSAHGAMETLGEMHGDWSRSGTGPYTRAEEVTSNLQKSLAPTTTVKIIEVK